MKKILVYLITVGVIAVTALFPRVMISPGDLNQGHSELDDSCLSCHRPFKGIDPNKCIKCHTLADIGKTKDTLTGGMANNKLRFHDKLQKQDCLACHSDHKGRSPGPGQTGFRHSMLSSGIASACGTCHDKPSNPLHDAVTVSCSSCHVTNTWKPEKPFNHNFIAASPGLVCTACHQQPKDEMHFSLSDNCEKCHNTSHWVPAEFEHADYFILDKHHNTVCKTCHPGNAFKGYTCYNCHEHTESGIIRKHNKEGIFNITDCVSCHPGANEHDIRIPQGDLNRMDNTQRNGINNFPERSGKRNEKNHEKKSGGAQEKEEDD